MAVAITACCCLHPMPIYVVNIFSKTYRHRFAIIAYLSCISKVLANNFYTRACIKIICEAYSRIALFKQASYRGLGKQNRTSLDWETLYSLELDHKETIHIVLVRQDFNPAPIAYKVSRRIIDIGWNNLPIGMID